MLMIYRRLVRFVTFLLGTVYFSPLLAFTCYYTLAKDSCWIRYNVTVEVIDATTSKILTTVTVPEGKYWTRTTFNCDTGQKLMYRAQFSPVIWDADKGSIYYAKNYLSLPNSLNSGDSAWNISVCYPSDFSQVPFPPDAANNCTCDFSTIPVIKMQQL